MIRKEGLNINSSKAFELNTPIAARTQQKKVNLHNRFYAELQQQKMTKMESMLP